MPSSFEQRAKQHGVGAFAHYRRNGWFVEPSVAWNRYRGTVQRPTLGNTEFAPHNTRITGKSASLTAGRTWQTSQQQTLEAYAAIRHHDIRRPAYQEDVVGFPVSYGAASFKETSAALGGQFSQPISPKLSWHTRAELEQHIRGNAPTFSAHADYLGNFHQQAKVNHTRAFLQTGLRYAFSPNVNVSVSPYVKRRLIGNQKDWGTVLSVEGYF